MQRVAFVGLGVMGSAIAANLLRAGFALIVYNRSRERALPLEGLGAKITNTPREAVEAADVVISMVTDDNASRAVWLGAEGILAGVKSGTILIELSTLSPSWVKELAREATIRGFAFLDAPVLGSKSQAEAGELIFLVGGEAWLLDLVRPIFTATGKNIIHLGSTGSGSMMKLIVNLLIGVQAVALAEGLLLAEQAGLEMDKAIQVIANGSAGSPFVKAVAPRIAARNYDTHFALHLLHKDMSYALEEAVRQTVPMPTVATAREIYRLAMARGLGDLDLSAVSEALR